MSLQEYTRQCFERLMRYPTVAEMSSLSDTDHVIEQQLALLIKDYQGIDVDLEAFWLVPDLFTARSFLDFCYDLHSRHLYKNPIVSDLAQFFAWLRLYGPTVARQQVQDWIVAQNEHKYQVQCLQTLLSWGEDKPPLTTHPSTLKVRLYGPYGTTGYARACRDIVRCLAERAPTLAIVFVPFTVQEFNPIDNSPENILLSRALPSREVDALLEVQMETVDLVVIHSVPDMWIPVVKREKALNPAVKVIGMTVWETDHFPFEWHPHFRWVDRVTFPNRWNTQALQIDLPGIDATFLRHPVVVNVEARGHGDGVMPPALARLAERKAREPDLYVMYSVNEFSGRKGIHLLMRAFLQEFRATDKVVLFLKTHGSVKEAVARVLLEQLHQEYPDSADVVIDYTKYDEDQITTLHALGDCFVSLTRSEGHGLGACAAALLGKRVIMTRYGGQLDYLTHIDWVPYRLTPAGFCPFFDENHTACRNLPSCRFFRFFLPTAQNWALPDTAAARRLMREAYTGRKTGDAETVAFLERVASPDAVAAAFDAYFHETVVTSSPYVTFPIRMLPDTYQRQALYFRPQQDVLAKADLDMTAIRGVRPRVVVLGCSGFGNVGDDLYVAMFQGFLGPDVDLVFVNTVTYASTTGLRWASDYDERNDDVATFDYLVIGGGGMLSDAELRSSIFTVYLPYCRAHNIPLALVSVGFGYTSIEGRAAVISPEGRRAYADLLGVATLVTVRSMGDRDMARSLMEPTRHHRIRLYPDLVYGAVDLFPTGTVSSTLPSSFVLFCPTGSVSVSCPDIADLLQKRLWEHRGRKLVALFMGGVDDPDIWPTTFVVEECARIQRLFPDAILYKGRYLSGPFLDLTRRSPPSDAGVQSLGLCVEMFRRASAIITGRFHGVILAKCCHRPVETGTSNLTKILEEIHSELQTSAWEGHLVQLRQDIVLRVCVPPTEARMLDEDGETWSDNVRNTCIVDVVTQTPPPEWTQTVPYIQGLVNHQLWDRKHRLLTSRFTPLPDRYHSCDTSYVTVV